jgi:hypothetical protein
MWISRRFSAASFFLDPKLRNAARARTVAASKLLSPSLP